MSDLISLQIKQLKEAKYILKLWMINCIKKKTESESRKRKEQWSIILLSSWPNGHIKSYLFSAADNCSVWVAVVGSKSFSPLFFLSTALVISLALNNSIVFKTKLLPRVTLKNKN